MEFQSKTLTPPKAIIFDVDGTLVDSIPHLLALPEYYAQTFNRSISEAQKQQSWRLFDDAMSGKVGEISLSTKILCNFIGQQDNTVMISLMLKTMTLLGIPLLQRMKGLKLSKTYFKERYFTSPLFPGTLKTLQILKNEKNIQLGILTQGSVKEFLNRFTDPTEILKLFSIDTIIGRDNAPKVKPAPDGIFLLSKLWGIPCEEIWMVGDMETDILAGKAAGAKTVGVLSGFLKRVDMEQIQPDLILSNVNEILDYLHKN